MKFDSTVKDKLLRLFLRSMPVPGPELYDLVVQIRRSQTNIDAQVSEAIESIQRTSTLVMRLESSLTERATKLKELQERHDHLSRLTSLEAEKATALLRQVEETVGKHRTREHVIGFGIHILAGVVLFVLGVFLSDSAKSIIYSFGSWIQGLVG